MSGWAPLVTFSLYINQAYSSCLEGPSDGQTVERRGGGHH
jgi:hypothetical protein